MIEFINSYGTALLFALNLVFWLLYYGNYKYLTKNTVNYRIIKFFISFLFIFSIWGISTFISELLSNNIKILIWLFFWTTLSIFELFFVLSALFQLTGAKQRYHDLFIILIAIVAIPIILASIMCWAQKTYSPINTADFYNMMLLMVGSIMIVRLLLQKHNFIDQIESFFIFAGFLLYFSLHILAGNVLSIDFLANFNFVTFANLISLIFWLGSLFFIWKIRSKHSL